VSLELKRPVIIGIGGLSSNVGKTTLMCELLNAFPGWEAIKTTRGHYRSCGKDSEACCVSHLLSDDPVLRSGRQETFAAGKDTGRYWDAGASNVHWVIATDTQVEKGIKLALERVKSEGVFVEGNSFSEYVPTNYFLMVRRPDLDAVKKSARRALEKTSAIYVSSLLPDVPAIITEAVKDLPVFTPSDLPILIERLRKAAE
jgi:molybdopterin-guanine dinucleotide biosynthesis protein